MAGPVPNHILVPTLEGDRLLCSGARGDAFVNGGGPDCAKCVCILREQETED